MKNWDKTFLLLGILVIAYAIFSRFYGKQGVAMMHFRSTSVFMAGNTLLLLAAITKKK
ncbi:MAG: hypothetical protein Q8N14_02235 [Candidatus Omnitrophota bacterium]|nr:hypothetical protein [Candidatus Omnitrophota bacterium]